MDLLRTTGGYGGDRIEVVDWAGADLTAVLLHPAPVLVDLLHDLEENIIYA